MAGAGFENVIRNAADLITPHERVVEGFIRQAKDKMRVAADYVINARTVQERLGHCATVDEILADNELRAAVLFSVGLSTKAQGHLTREEIDTIVRAALDALSQNCDDLASDVLYRYLLTAGDTLGGSMRNLTGAYAQQLVAGKVQDGLRQGRVEFDRQVSPSGKVQIITWANRVMVFDKKPRFIGNNIDIILLNGRPAAGNSLIERKESYLAAGELKGGIDPAGADEHWKTATRALERIRDKFSNGSRPHLFFAGAAIESAMATEIYNDVSNGRLSFAANLTSNAQVNALVAWLISI